MAYVCPGSRPLYAQQSSHAFLLPYLLLLETLDGENSWLQPVAETQKATRKDLGPWDIWGRHATVEADYANNFAS